MSRSVRCFGAAALSTADTECKPATYADLDPPASKAADDESAAYTGDGIRSDCFSHPSKFPDVDCSFADKSSSVNVALVGNSHAGQWVPALERLANKHHWHLTTYLASQCALADVEQHFDGAALQGCRDWVHRTTGELIARHFDLVVVTNRVSVSAVGARDAASNLELYRRGYASELRRLSAAGEPVVVIHDTPAPGVLVPSCLLRHRGDLSACDGHRSTWLAPDPAVDAVRDVETANVTAIDLSDHICGPAICPAVVGGVPVYKDASHLTATFDRTLAPYLAPVLTRALGR